MKQITKPITSGNDAFHSYKTFDLRISKYNIYRIINSGRCKLISPATHPIQDSLCTTFEKGIWLVLQHFSRWEAHSFTRWLIPRKAVLFFLNLPL